MEDLKKFFVKSELIPAIVQDYKTKEVLMLAYMNEESLAKTLETGMTWFYSRSRKELWNKGATSGHVQKVIKIDYDCDEDTLLVFVDQTGAACHTGNRSCFYRTLAENGDVPETNPLLSLEQVVEHRKTNPEEGSYTCYLFEKGLDKILKKVGEECAETIIAAKNDNMEDLTGEIADLMYHLTVMMSCRELPMSAVMDELEKRSHKIGNLKKMKTVDRNT
ncbi:MAG: bifunctional phosphoribosyl-AMP cyclohydrolase/phosphoribosyl-ATP diphosphatase HisIE [Ruminococcaceae bacterium]|nr:bifunctional phosphoribosyl-AMP cyclohydrolase/phosphoribosyl-ATP diphosphatase HisIE [Oscillospiraceae bacterium]